MCEEEGFYSAQKGVGQAEEVITKAHYQPKSRVMWTLNFDSKRLSTLFHSFQEILLRI